MNNKRSEAFNEIAEIYNAARPNYPLELIEDVITIANIKENAKILEVGVGTGQATISFAQKGYAIHGLDPGDKLIAIASQNLSSYPKVTFEKVTFEDYQLKEKSFDLLISAQAFHWVNREIGYSKAALALKDKGHIALFWNFSPKSNTTVFQELEQAFQQYLPEMVYNPPSIDSLIEKRKNWILDSECFKEPVFKEYVWSIDYDVDRYLNLLKTQTVYQQFNEIEKQDLSTIVRKILNNHGGYISKPYLSALFCAEKI
ncbi:MAG: class I SAM-dependent methyltransferase [Scytonematopsis contorta HA4267-MV1]|jgi:ubiquinone/menaquinone biosynthesis C-methylase UbiE|nr:class I SAM-dependent methyltransferase [Scytonematopsis contorta HA4267-MV1]